MLLLDNSAWSRLLTGALSPERRETVIEWIDEQRLGTCLPFLLEAGYSARSARDHREMLSQLEHLPRLPVDGEVEHAALKAQRELAEVGHHRLPPTDLVIAACAARAGGGVLHCDRDYDLITKHTQLAFQSVWVTEAGAS